MRIEVDACDACPVPDGAVLLRSEDGGFLLHNLEPFEVIDGDGSRREVLLCEAHSGQLRQLVGLVPTTPSE